MKPGIGLKAMREALHWTQAYLAGLAKLSPSQVSNLETGHRNIGKRIRPRLAQAFKMSEGEFMQAIHSDKDTATFLAILHQIQDGDRDKLLRKMSEALESLRETPENFNHLIAQIDIFISLTKK